MTDHRTLGGDASVALAINERGDIVGYGTGINDAGEIAGFACRPHPVEQSGLDCAGVVLIPVPEPPPWMLWTGAILLGGAARARLHRQGKPPCMQPSSVSRSPPAAATRPA